MHPSYWLAVIPFLALLGGPILANRVTPFVFGMPLLLAWIVISILVTSAVMAIIYRLDPVNRGAEE